MTSPSKCLITGCEFYDAVENKFVHGDLHELGPVYIFRSVVASDGGDNNWIYDVFPHPENKILVAHGSYFDRPGVLVIQKSVAQLNTTALDYLKA